MNIQRLLPRWRWGRSWAWPNGGRGGGWGRAESRWWGRRSAPPEGERWGRRRWGYVVPPIMPVWPIIWAVAVAVVTEAAIAAIAEIPWAFVIPHRIGGARTKGGEAQKQQTAP